MEAYSFPERRLEKGMRPTNPLILVMSDPKQNQLSHTFEPTKL